ncbi:hypothetical protein LTR33_005649 [Friedmanniomyces endolithicus]|nr:hypothetical protein LTR33_005649 [Friedmanniomyces endolithicus]
MAVEIGSLERPDCVVERCGARLRRAGRRKWPWRRRRALTDLASLGAKRRTVDCADYEAPDAKKPRTGKAKADDEPPEDEEFLDEVDAYDLPSDDAEEDLVDEREPFMQIAISASSQQRSRRLSKQSTHTTIATHSKTTHPVTTQKKTSSTEL